MAKQTCLVMTTIGDGTFVERCAEAIRREALPGRICVIVIPDRKSPPSLFETCDRVKQGGIDVLCPSIEAQDAYLAKFGAIKGVIPYNSDNRRNIGFLLALEQGCDVMISVDDDNYPLPETAFLTEHLVVGQRAEAESIASDDGWFNICDLLEIEPRTTYPRGFPYSRRHQDRKTTTTREEGVVHVNAGLWLGHPDIDAVSCLYAPARSKAFKGKSVFLGQDTWSPINTQNTAIVREAIAAYYFWRMGYPLMGMPIDRDGDIFSGYCVQACARHLGYRVRVGTPIADHRRNSHNYMKDLTYELACIWILEDFTQWLHDVRLEGGNYLEAYSCLAARIDDQVESFSGFIWNDAARGYFHYMAHSMRTWIRTVKLVGGCTDA